jgi:hypothetical protein
MNTRFRHHLLRALLVSFLWTPSYAHTAPASQESPSRYGATALMQAASAGSVDRVDSLTAAGANVKAKDNEGATALMLAKSHFRIVAAL